MDAESTKTRPNVAVAGPPKSNWEKPMFRKREPGPWFWGRWGVAAIAACTLSIVACIRYQTVSVEAAGGAEPTKEGRLSNIAEVPFKYRLARRRGKPWTEEMTLAPGKFQAIRAPKPGESSELEGLTGRGDGYVNVSYPELGGYIHLHLSARNMNDELEPNWYHVKDSNGFSRLLKAATIEEAKARQKKLMDEEPLTLKEIEKTKRLLKANWVLYDK